MIYVRHSILPVGQSQQELVVTQLINVVTLKVQVFALKLVQRNATGLVHYRVSLLQPHQIVLK